MLPLVVNIKTENEMNNPIIKGAVYFVCICCVTIVAIVTTRVILHNSPAAKEIVCRTPKFENAIGNVELYSFRPTCAESKVFFTTRAATWKECHLEGGKRVCEEGLTQNFSPEDNVEQNKVNP